MTARLAAAVVLGLGLAAAGGAQDPPAKPPAASVRDAIYFGPAGPVRVRLNVSIDGRPADAVWADAVNGLFAFCDRDGDGFLNPAERAAFAPPARSGREIELLIDGAQPAVEPLRLTFPGKDEKVSRAAFAEALRTAGRGPITLRVVPGRADSQQLSAALFRNLDPNGDGRLSPDELKAARDRLATLDIDEDEVFTAAEVLGRGVVANADRVRPILPGTRPPADPAEPSTELLFLTADGPQAALKQLLAARAGPRATALKKAEFGGDGKAFAVLDQDGNGALDTTELTAWLQKPPELELAVTFDSAGAKLIGRPDAALPGGRFRFEPPQGAPTKAWQQAADRLREQFKELGKEAGAVERKQLENQPPLLAFFDLADRNGDGKVDAAEVEAALKAVAPLVACRVDVAFLDRGNGLFERLDRNDDGRLSPREWVEAVVVLKPFAGPDGSVGPKDLVRQFQVRLVVEPAPVGLAVPPASPAAATASPAPVAAWFTKADRNGDGDVSLREFLGPIELFRKLDRDGDGLVSPAEAAGTGK